MSISLPVRVRALVLVLASLCALAAGALVFVTTPASAAGDANEAFCPAETEASPGFRSYLPDCRAYELVTPPFKDAFAFDKGSPQELFVSQDGSRVVASSFGVMAETENDPFEGTQNKLNGAVYGLSRQGEGWQIESLEPSSAYVQGMGYSLVELAGLSGDMDRTLWRLGGGADGRGGSGPQSDAKLVERQPPDGKLEEVGPVYPAGSEGGTQPATVGASADLDTIVEEVKQQGNGSNVLWRGDETVSEGESLYMYSGLNDPEPKLIGVRNAGTFASNLDAEQISQCGTWLGSYKGESTYDAVSEEGRVVFFTVAGEGQGQCDATHVPSKSPPVVNELYARVDGNRTVAISEPGSQRADCTGTCETAAPQPATFQGASAEPSGPNRVIRVFFTTTQPLLNEDRDTSNDLYEADIALGEPGSQSAHLEKLVMVSRGEEAVPGKAPTADGNGANVLGVARVSSDGSHVYYVAEGVLSDGANSEGKEAEAVHPNLYCFDTETGATSFVAALATTGDKGDWSQKDERPVQTTPSGLYLLFPSSARLTSDDTSTEGKQLFEYDSETGHLARVSIGEDHSYNHDGNIEEENGEAREQYAPKTNNMKMLAYTGAYDLPGQGVQREHRRVLTETGQVFFESANKLTELALSTGEGEEVYAMNVYEYNPAGAGNVYLISDGQDESTFGEGKAATRLGGASLTGGNVFFQTPDQLVPQDDNTMVDIYDAREDGGFPAPAPYASCEEDESCQGGGSSAPLLTSPTSASYSNGVNLPPPPPPVVKPKAKSKPAKCGSGFVKKKGKCVRQPKAKKRALKSNRSRKVGSR